MRTLICRSVLALVLPMLATAAPVGAQIIDLGNLGNDGYGDSYSTASSINNLGQIVGTSLIYDSSGNPVGYRGFIYSNGVMTQLPISFPPGLSGDTIVTSINDAGQITGFSNLVNSIPADRGQMGFIYHNGEVTQLGNFGTSFAGNTYTAASHINNLGQVVGTSERFDSGGGYQGTHSFLYSNGQMTDLGNFGHQIANASLNQAPSINDAGQIIVDSALFDTFGNITGNVAYLYHNGQAVDLGSFGVSSTGRTYTSASGLNNAGEVVGGSEVYDAGGNYLGYAAFLYKNGQLTNLGDFSVDGSGHFVSQASAINDIGQIVGFSEIYDSSGNDLGADGFLYEHGQMIDLQTLFGANSGWSNLQPAAINDLGQIVGTGIYNGNDEAFLINAGTTVVPEPGTRALMPAAGLCAAGLLLRRRRKLPAGSSYPTA